VSIAIMRHEEETLHTRTRWSMVASVGLHVLLLFAFVTYKPDARHEAPVTEITWMDSEESAPAEPAPGVPVSNSIAAQLERHFRRASRDADLAPTPQSDMALDDRLNARLTALQGAAGLPASSASTPSPSFSAPAGDAGGTGIGAAKVKLERGGTGVGGPALELTRGGGSSAAAAPALAATGIPAEKSAAAAPAKTTGETAHKTLAGAQLLGPVADRAILSHPTPVYPDWAKNEAVEGSVTLYFVVRSDGTVKENVVVQKTAGFEDFDENARTALLNWRFEPLRDGRTGEQWGTITFNFRLRDGG